MTDRQYHQDNERQGRYTASNTAAPSSTLPLRSMYPEAKRFRLVPAAIICAFVVVGLVIFYNYRQNAALSTSVQASPVVEAAVSTKAPVASVTPNAVTMTDDTVEVATATPASLTNTNVTVTSGDQTVTVPATRSVNADGTSTINININAGDLVATAGKASSTQTVKTVQTVQAAQPQVVTVPVQTVNYVPAGGYYNNGYYYYPNNYYQSNTGTNNKPWTPYLETCGNADGDRWNDTKIVLPKYEKDGKAAVEYEVNVGTSVGASDTHSHRYQQTDRVVFGISIDNNREYFVRYRVRFEGGDFGDWSDTFRFTCHRW